MTRVTFVIQKLAGLTGGAERILVEVANAMAARGLAVDIVTYETRNAPPHYPLRNVGVHNLFPLSGLLPPARPHAAAHHRRSERLIKRLPNTGPVPHLKWSVTYAPFIHLLRRHLKRHKPDTVVGVMPTGIMVAAMAAKGLPVRVIGSTHNVPEQDYGDSGRWDGNPVYVRAKRAALSDLDHLLVLLPEFRTWFDPPLHPRISVMPNPIAPATGPLPQASERARLIVGVGRLTAIKRYDVLVRAWTRIAGDHPDWRLEIYGDGPEKPALQSLIAQSAYSKRIRLAGSTEAIFDVYRQAAILCHPSRFEGFGLSVGEAMAHGLPVVGSEACSGLNTLVETGKTGCLVPDGDAFEANLAQALDRLIQTPELREALGTAGPEAMHAYAPARIFDLWETLLREGIAPR